MHRDAHHRGSVLITSLLLSTILGVGLVAYLQLTKTSLKMANRTFLGTDAANLAEAGLEEALCAFTLLNAGQSAATAWGSWTRSGITATRTLTFNHDLNNIGIVKVYVRGYDGSFETPYIISQATVTPLDSGPPVVKVRRMDMQAYNSPGAALVGLSGLSWAGSSTVDSFLSSTSGSSGPWSAYPAGGARSKACVIVPAGTVTLGATGRINGDLKLGPAVTPPSVGTVTGTTTNNYSGSWNLPTLPPWSSLLTSRVCFLSLPSTLPVSGHAAAADGCYYYVMLGGNISSTTITAGKNVIILGIGVGLNAGLTVQAGAHCIIYIDQEINCASAGAITNNSWAGGLQVFTWTSSTCSLGNSGQTMGCIFAPFAPVRVTGGATTGSFVGSIVAKTITVSGKMDFHYDECLGSLGSIGSIGSIGSPGTTANSALVGIARTKWSEVRSQSDRAQLGTLTSGFLP